MMIATNQDVLQTGFHVSSEDSTLCTVRGMLAVHGYQGSLRSSRSMQTSQDTWLPIWWGVVPTLIHAASVILHNVVQLD